MTEEERVSQGLCSVALVGWLVSQSVSYLVSQSVSWLVSQLVN